MKKIGFLFGAGVEKDYYGLPSGSQYINETILAKRSKLYDALKDFYMNRVNNNYAGNYQKEFIFQKNSVAYREIIIRAVEKLIKTKDRSDDCYVNNLIDKFKKTKNENLTEEELKLAINELNSLIEEGFEDIISDFDKSSDMKVGEIHEDLKENFSYYGSIEKDFATIIDPIKAGNTKFWRLINYFWGAYFSVILPMIERSHLHIANLNRDNINKYKYVLNDIKKITRDLYSEEYLESFTGGNSNDYYKAIADKFDNISGIITTNYTPFVKRMDISRDQIAFLAGELSIFEVPNKLMTINMLEAEDFSKELLFPFIFTQAPVKPIIEPRSLTEYAKMIDILNITDCLIIIGYSLSEYDNHVNAFLRDFLVKGRKRIIYCKYIDSTNIFVEHDIKRDVCKKLKISDLDKAADNLTVVMNNGKVKDLIERITLNLN